MKHLLGQYVNILYTKKTMRKGIRHYSKLSLPIALKDRMTSSAQITVIK